MIDRSGFIGSSDVAALLGMSPWKTPLGLYLEKRGEIAAEEIDSDETNFGRHFQSAVLETFVDKTGIRIDTDGLIAPVRFHHPDYPFLTCEPDAWTLPMIRTLDGYIPAQLVEAKTATIYHRSEWSDGVPAYYALQCHHQMLVTGATKVWVPVYFDDRHFEIYSVERDDELLADLLAAELEFWQRVQDGNPPPVTSQDSETLAKWFPRSVEATVALDDLRRDIDRALELKDIIKSYTDELAYHENRIKERLGRADTGLVDGEKRVSWREQSREGIDAKALKAEEPEIFAKFAKVSTFRVLRFHGAKEEK